MPTIRHIHKRTMEIQETDDLIVYVCDPNNVQIAVLRIHWNNPTDPFDIKILVSTQMDAAGLEVTSSDPTDRDNDFYVEFPTPYVEIIPLVELEDEDDNGNITN